MTMTVTLPDSTQDTTHDELQGYLDAAEAAAGPWAVTPPAARANVLDRVAAALDAAADELVPVAMSETNLPEARLRGELKRTSFQMRLFGEVLREGSYLDARIDHADPQWPMGAPRPDLRRSYRPIGPVGLHAHRYELILHGRHGPIARPSWPLPPPPRQSQPQPVGGQLDHVHAQRRLELSGRRGG